LVSPTIVPTDPFAIDITILHRLLATFPFLIGILKYKKIGPNAG
jgi:hypothetical protein